MKWDNLRRWDVVSPQDNRALPLRRAAPQENAAIRKCARAGLDGQPAARQVAFFRLTNYLIKLAPKRF